MKKIIILRHSDAVKHPTLKYTIDKLSLAGEEKAERIISNFKYNGGEIICSPYIRTKQTAKYFTNNNIVETVYDDDWSEANMGIFQERPYQEFLDDWSKHDYSYDYIPPKGESVNQLRKRIIKGTKKLLGYKSDILCVTHAGLIANLLMMLFEFDFEKAKPLPCEVITLVHEGEYLILKSTYNPSLVDDTDIKVPISKLFEFNKL